MRDKKATNPTKLHGASAGAQSFPFLIGIVIAIIAIEKNWVQHVSAEQMESYWVYYDTDCSGEAGHQINDAKAYGPACWDKIKEKDAYKLHVNWDEEDGASLDNYGKNRCKNTAARDSNPGNDDEEEQSPKLLQADRSCPDRHRMGEENGLCYWEDVDFVRTRYSLRAEFNNCTQRPYIDYSFSPAKQHLHYLEFRVPAEHKMIRNGQEMSFVAELTLAHVGTSGDDHELSNVNILYELGEQCDPYIDRYLYFWVMQMRESYMECATRKGLNSPLEDDWFHENLCDLRDIFNSGGTLFNGGSGGRSGTRYHFEAETEAFEMNFKSRIASIVPGFTGSGYVNFGGQGSYVEMGLGVDSSGLYAFFLRYAACCEHPRTSMLYVNGVYVADVAFEITGSYDTWDIEIIENVKLTKGENVIKIVSVGEGPNLDSVELEFRGAFSESQSSGTSSARPSSSPEPSSSTSSSPSGSSEPSITPSSTPSRSSRPSMGPSVSPSSSSEPSVIPSSIPSWSSSPSTIPSAGSTRSPSPSTNPSSIPSLSFSPENRPSSIPSWSPESRITITADALSSVPSNSPTLLSSNIRMIRSSGPSMSSTPTMVTTSNESSSSNMKFRSSLPTISPTVIPSWSSKPSTMPPSTPSGSFMQPGNIHDAVRYEAEYHSEQENTFSTRFLPNFSGEFYTVFGGNGSFVEWNNVTIDDVGEYIFKFRYATANVDSPCSFSLNGYEVKELAFRNTGSLKSWTIETFSLRVTRAGSIPQKVIKLKANRDGLNLDYMEVQFVRHNTTRRQLDATFRNWTFRDECEYQKCRSCCTDTVNLLHERVSSLRGRVKSQSETGCNTCSKCCNGINTEGRVFSYELIRREAPVPTWDEMSRIEANMDKKDHRALMKYGHAKPYRLLTKGIVAEAAVNDTDFYFRYDGSQTFPPCYTTTEYRVMLEPRKLCERQQNALEDMIAAYLDEDCRMGTVGKLRSDCKVDVNRPLQYHKKGASGIGMKMCEEWKV